MKRILLFIAIIILVFGCKPFSNDSQLIRLLIISGSNNHEWQQTTPFLEKMFDKSGIFEASTTSQPDTLNYKVFKNFDAIISNWNSWPDNDFRWSAETENGLLKYVEEGGGLVFFHSSTSAFYEWPEFKDISIGAWVEETWHGKPSPIKVSIGNQEHPITQGLSDFYIFDELWINAEQNESFQALGSAINDEASEKGNTKQPAIFVSEYGKGRVFHTLLGHDVRAMRNTGFQTLLLRGTEWAASSKVSLSIPQELQLQNMGETSKFSWIENDSCFALLDHNRIVWQFNYNTKHGKPFFHPIYVNKNRITCLSPDDHIWHLGQWFSWKFINERNYWEYIGNTHQSEGITDITDIKIKRGVDFSAEITLKIEYHPQNGETILGEDRIIQIS
ncbi:MAG: ThuA domain-containing protein, partial [Bacteroidales bacterium]|nr:ThuA domain-containing protein [Bacteroidales bacterium]